MADTGLPLQRVRSQIDTSSSSSGGGAPASPKKYERGGRMGRGFAPTTLMALVALVCVGTWRYTAIGGAAGKAQCVAVNELRGLSARALIEEQGRRPAGLGAGVAAPRVAPAAAAAEGGGRETVLVTGGLGFIGSHVVEELLARSYAVIVYDDESNGHNHNLGALNVHGDVTVVHDFRQLLTLPVTVDYVVHLAAAISVAESMTMPEKYARINEEGSKKVFLWALAHGVKHVVAASSAAVYGVPPASAMPLKESEPYRGISPYAKSKYAMEDTMRDLSRSYGLCATGLRFFNVYVHAPRTGRSLATARCYAIDK